MQPVGMNWLVLAQDAATKAAEAQDSGSSWQGLLVFAASIAIVVLPFMAGNALAAALKMKELGTRLGVTLLALTLCSLPFFMQPLSEALSLGIDLAGGTNLVYEIDREAIGDKPITPQIMESMVEAVRKRVNPTGTEEVTVRGVGADRIEVIVPGADQEKVERTKRNIVNLGELEFALLANSADHAQEIQEARKQGTSVKTVIKNNQVIAEWHEANVDEEGKLKLDPGEVNGNVERRVVKQGDKEAVEYLVIVDPDKERRITGRMLASVGQSIGDRGLTVTFRMDSAGTRLFREVTTKYKPRDGAGYKTHLAILLNGKIETAPVIDSPIPSGQGEINGRFSKQEIEELLSVLNAGSLVVPLKKTPANESTISPLLGVDVQQKGKLAMILSLALVFGFTAVYYLKAGFVADVCLALNILMVLGIMAIIDATFTLPGLAGLVLTVGMAVDANVLIFERMREEMAKGSSLRMAIKNGFDKAFSTIFDSNLTTLLTAIVLYYVGTDTVRGFAVVLFTGICTSMFTAVYVGRIMFEVAERKKWLTDLKMFSLVPMNSKFDFVGKTRACITGSIVLIAFGLVVFSMRGRENLDIDFRGGALVTFRFEEGANPTIDEIEAALKPQFTTPVSLEELQVKEGDGTRTMYRMRTITSDEQHEETAELVMGQVKAAFQDTPFKLVLQSLTWGAVEQIPDAEKPAESTSLIDPFAGGHSVAATLKEPMTAIGFAEAARSYIAGLGEFSEEDLESLVTGAVASDQASDAKVVNPSLKFAKSITPEQIDKFLPAVKTGLEADPLFEEVNTFDSQVAGEAQSRAIYAMLLSLALIVIYLWVRFQSVHFGVAAVLALVHDVLFTLGAIAVGAYLSGTPLRNILFLEDFKINLPIVAAFLTLIGYSINDTIVVFDRIRELRGRNPKLTMEMVNASLNQTLSRTILTSFTTWIVIVILYFVGGEGVHGFAYCLLVGIFVGTYSSVYIASPVLVWLMNRDQKRPTVPAPAPATT